MRFRKAKAPARPNLSYGDPLITLRAHGSDAGERGVRFECAVCGCGFTLPTHDVLQMVCEAGLGDEYSSVSVASHLTTCPCVRCGGGRWRARPMGEFAVRRPDSSWAVI